MTVPLRAGGYVLGVRANTAEVGVLLRRLFADRVVDNAEPPANLSVHLAPEVREGVRGVHQLYLNCRWTARSSSQLRLLEALWHELDIRDVQAAGKVTFVDALAFIHEGRAHLFPGRYRRAYVFEQRRWSRAGFFLIDRRWLEFDIRAGTVTIPAPVLCRDGDRKDTLATRDATEQQERTSPTGTFPIGSWTLGTRPLSPGQRLMTAARCVSQQEQLDRSHLLQDLAALLGRLPGADQIWPNSDELRAWLATAG